MKAFTRPAGLLAIAPLLTGCLSATLPPYHNTTTNATSLATGLNSTANPYATLLVDAFSDIPKNALGFYHGASGDASVTDFDGSHPGNELVVSTDNIDASFVTSLSDSCIDFSAYKDQYIHIAYRGSSRFTVSLHQHNKECDESKSPFPETFDSVQAARYATPDERHIYIPVSHFRVNLARLNGIAVENWYTRDQTIIYRVEMVQAAGVPQSVKTVARKNTGTLWNGCVNPNHIAFGIDDGVPELMQRALQIIKDEKIPVTFFVQGSALLLSEEDGNFTEAYREMIDEGHQIGLHTETHPHMEAVKTEREIEYEISENVKVVKEKLGVDTTSAHHLVLLEPAPDMLSVSCFRTLKLLCGQSIYEIGSTGLMLLATPPGYNTRLSQIS